MLRRRLRKGIKKRSSLLARLYV